MSGQARVGCPRYKEFRVDLVKATTSGFSAAVHRLPFKGDGKDAKGVEGYVYKLPLQARFRWRAEGIPDPQYDARSPWLRLTLPQRIFSIAGVLFLIGLAADLAGLIGFAMQLSQRH